MARQTQFLLAAPFARGARTLATTPQQAGPIAVKSAAKRIDAIDFWRGFALVTIFVDHVPDNIFQQVTYRNFGFSDAAELFVFLSGASVAIAYGSRFFRGESTTAIRAVLRRAFTLYWVQALISLLIIGLFAAVASYYHGGDLLDEPDRDVMVSNPLRGIAAMLVLSHQLANVNILPLYIVLLVLTPALLVLARRSDWLMLAFSGVIYAGARVFEVNLPTWPLDGVWYFNPLAWQFIFALGLFVGRRLRHGGIGYERRVFAVSLGFVVTCAIVATDCLGIASGLADQALELLDHTKTDLGLIRIVHFLALAYVISHSGVTGLFRWTPVFAPLALMGRYSLPVFATGSVLTAVAEVIVRMQPEDFAHPFGLAGVIVAAGILIHYFVARLLAMHRALHPRPTLATAMR
jgi:hypothetical protein